MHNVTHAQRAGSHRPLHALQSAKIYLVCKRAMQLCAAELEPISPHQTCPCAPIGIRKCCAVHSQDLLAPARRTQQHEYQNFAVRGAAHAIRARLKQPMWVLTSEATDVCTSARPPRSCKPVSERKKAADSTELDLLLCCALVPRRWLPGEKASRPDRHEQAGGPARSRDTYAPRLAARIVMCAALAVANASSCLGARQPLTRTSNGQAVHALVTRTRANMQAAHMHAQARRAL